MKGRERAEKEEDKKKADSGCAMIQKTINNISTQNNNSKGVKVVCMCWCAGSYIQEPIAKRELYC